MLAAACLPASTSTAKSQSAAPSTSVADPLSPAADRARVEREWYVKADKMRRHLLPPLAQRPLTYPAARQVPQVDVYHGQEMRDPFRWLEDLQSPETAAWVDAQNALTDQHPATVASRSAIQARIRALSSYWRVMGPRGGRAMQAGTTTFFRRLEPGDAQPKVYVQHGTAPPPLLLDPNTWSNDRATQLEREIHRPLPARRRSDA